MARQDNLTIDTSDFDSKIRIIQVSFPMFLGSLMKKLGLRLLTKVKLLTPVDKGLLRRSWFLESPKVTPTEVSIEIKNNTEYSEAVEFGHKLRNGRFYSGKFMLRKSMTEMENEIENTMETEIQRFMNRM